MAEAARRRVPLRRSACRHGLPQSGTDDHRRRLVAFAGLTGDYSELHTSDVYAKSSQFGRRVAHGMLGLAYAHGLMWPRTGELRETAIAFLGISEWKFRGPDLRRRHDLRELSHRRAARQQVEADAGDREVRRRGREPGRARRAAGRKALLMSKVPLTAVEASRG